MKDVVSLTCLAIQELMLSLFSVWIGDGSNKKKTNSHLIGTERSLGFGELLNFGSVAGSAVFLISEEKSAFILH